MTTDWSAYSELFFHYLVNPDFLKRDIPSELYSFVQLIIDLSNFVWRMRFTGFTKVLITPWWLIFPCACTLYLVSCLWERISLSWWPQVHRKIHYHGMFELLFSFLRRKPQPQKLGEHITTLLPWQFLCMHAMDRPIDPHYQKTLDTYFVEPDLYSFVRLVISTLYQESGSFNYLNWGQTPYCFFDNNIADTRR